MGSGGLMGGVMGGYVMIDGELGVVELKIEERFIFCFWLNHILSFRSTTLITFKPYATTIKKNHLVLNPRIGT